MAAITKFERELQAVELEIEKKKRERNALLLKQKKAALESLKKINDALRISPRVKVAAVAKAEEDRWMTAELIGHGMCNYSPVRGKNKNLCCGLREGVTLTSKGYRCKDCSAKTGVNLFAVTSNNRWLSHDNYRFKATKFKMLCSYCPQEGPHKDLVCGNHNGVTSTEVGARCDDCIGKIGIVAQAAAAVAPARWLSLAVIQSKIQNSNLICLYSPTRGKNRDLFCGNSVELASPVISDNRCVDCHGKNGRGAILLGVPENKAPAPSKGIRLILASLARRHLTWELEKTFPGMEDRAPLRIDIYLPSQKGVAIPICIEYDGDYLGSHFKYSSKKEEKAHIETVRRDKIKDVFVVTNGCHMVRIPFSVKDSVEAMEVVIREMFSVLERQPAPMLYLVNSELYRARDHALAELARPTSRNL